MRRPLKVSRRASLQIRTAAVWWLHNRPKAPEAFADEIDRGFDLVSRLPSTGERVAHSNVAGIRRILLGRIRYHLYYRVSEQPELTEILSLWHTSRGTPPDLP